MRHSFVVGVTMRHSLLLVYYETFIVVGVTMRHSLLLVYYETFIVVSLL